MLNILRDSAGTWPAKIILGLLILSFGVWGVSGSILGGAGNTVLEVGNTRISTNDYLLAYERARFTLSQQFGRLLNRNEARAFGLDNNVLNQLVSSAVLDENASNMGLGLSSQNLATIISKDTAFQDASGNFNRDQLRQALRQIGMSEKDYVISRQNVAVRNQLVEGVLANTSVPQAYLDAFDAYRNEQRVFEYLVLDANALDAAPIPTANNLKDYYQANKSLYVAPEYRKLTVVKMEAEDIADAAAVSAEEIKEDYEARKSSFTTDEQREIQQLTFATAEEADAAGKKLADGMEFDALLAELGKTEKDVQLGTFAKSALPDPQVAEAAFGLEVGKASGVVTGIFGPVILRVVNITPEVIKPLSEVEAEIRENIAKTTAADELFDTHDRLEDERAAGDTLAEAARKVQLTPRTIERVDAAGRTPEGKTVKDLPQSAQLLRAAFDSAEGVETDPISIGSEGFVWYNVEEVVAERQKPFEEVEAEVKEAWGANETAEKVADIAEAIKAEMAKGNTLAQARDTILGEKAANYKVDKSADMDRDASSDALPSGLVKTAFAKAKGEVIVQAGATAQNQVVLSTSEIKTGAGKSVTPDQKQTIDSSIGDDILLQMIAKLREGQPVHVYQQAINAAQSSLR